MSETRDYYVKQNNPHLDKYTVFPQMQNLDLICMSGGIKASIIKLTHENITMNPFLFMLAIYIFRRWEVGHLGSVFLGDFY